MTTWIIICAVLFFVGSAMQYLNLLMTRLTWAIGPFAFVVCAIVFVAFALGGGH